MTALPRRQQNRIDRENRILKAALTVFANAGYSGATMDAVAMKAGLSKPTLYQYFAGKEALFTAMMAARRDDMLVALEAPGDAPMVSQLYEFAWAYADTVLSLIHI